MDKPSAALFFAGGRIACRRGQKCESWGAHPERINTQKPPAHRVGGLFQQGKPPRKYKKPVDGKLLFEKLNLEEVASRCPQFKAFLNSLLDLAGYPLL